MRASATQAQRQLHGLQSRPERTKYRWAAIAWSCARRAVAEQLALVRAHLEEPEVLAVLRPRAQARLAPGDVRPPASSTCRRRGRSPASGSCAARRRASRARSPSERRAIDLSALREALRRVARGSCLASARCSPEERSWRLLSKNRIVPRYLRAFARASLEPLVESQGLPLLLRDLGRGLGRGRRFRLRRCRSGLSHETNANRPTSRALKRLPPGRGQGRGRPRRPLVSLDRAHGTRTRTRRAACPYKELRKPVTSVTARGNDLGDAKRARLRGRDSNPNFPVQSRASCR